MKKVIIRKLRRNAVGNSKELVFIISDYEIENTITALLTVAKRLQGFSFEITATSEEEVIQSMGG